MAYNGIVTLNPIMSQSSNDVNVFYLTQIQLVRYYGDEVQCDAAETYDVNDDWISSMQHTAYWLLRWEVRQPAAGMPSRTQNSSTMEK